MNILHTRYIKPLGLSSLILFFTACSSMPGALQSNDLSHLSLRDKRMADKHIQVQTELPNTAQSLGQITTTRCQATLFSEAPENETLLMDIKAQAYRLGANGISDVKFTQKGAVSDGCWNLFTATADMFVFRNL